MATRPRKGKPEFWASNLAKFLAGDWQCEWRVWFKSRFRHDKVADPDFDTAAYKAQHDAMVDAKVTALAASDYTVAKEQFFAAVGSFSKIVGRTDILAQKNGTVLIVDAKTGQKRDSDWFQVLIYMVAIPIAWERPNLRIVGEVEYKDGTRRSIEPEELTGALRQRITVTVKRLALLTDPPPHSPSEQECRYCDIGPNDCTKRIGPTPEQAPQTELF